MQLEAGAVYDGKVTGITKFGAFVELEPGVVGMVHISEISTTYVDQVESYLTLGQEVKVKLLALGEGKKISLSIKRVAAEGDAPQREQRPPREPEKKAEPLTEEEKLDDMIKKFKQASEEKILALKRSNEGKRGGGYSSRKR